MVLVLAPIIDQLVIDALILLAVLRDDLFDEKPIKHLILPNTVNSLIFS